MVKNIIFDLGNVIIEWNSDRVYDKYFKTVSEKETFYNTTKIKELNLELDRGLPFEIGLSKLADSYPLYSEAIWLWKHSWVEMLGNELTGTLAMVEQLKSKGYALYALTNWAHETFIYAEENFKWLDHFLDIVVSGRVGLIKPEPEIFELLLKRNNLQASECLFIDDSLPNVQSAKFLGMDAIHFTSSNQLEKDIKARKIL